MRDPGKMNGVFNTLIRTMLICLLKIRFTKISSYYYNLQCNESGA